MPKLINVGQPSQLDLLFIVGLSGYKVEMLTEIYKVDEDGRRASSLGFLRNKVLAEVFADNQTDPGNCRFAEVPVLHNGESGFRIGEPVTLLVEETVYSEVRKKVLGKLSEAEREMFKLES